MSSVQGHILYVRTRITWGGVAPPPVFFSMRGSSTILPQSTSPAYELCIKYSGLTARIVTHTPTHTHSCTHSFPEDELNISHSSDWGNLSLAKVCEGFGGGVDHCSVLRFIFRKILLDWLKLKPLGWRDDHKMLLVNFHHCLLIVLIPNYSPYDLFSISWLIIQSIKLANGWKGETEPSVIQHKVFGLCLIYRFKGPVCDILNSFFLLVC